MLDTTATTPLDTQRSATDDGCPTREEAPRRSSSAPGPSTEGVAEQTFDWNDPAHIAAEFVRRADRLARIRADKSGKLLAALRAYYAEHPADFINDWALTFDPRNGPNGLPSVLPFLLFPRQREFVEWVDRLRRQGAKGLADKSRDMGFSWLLVSTAATLCLFGSQMTFGFGSRDEDSVDQSGNPDSLFWKLRFFIENLPEEFRGGWQNRPPFTSHMRVSFPTTRSVITGDAGKNIGRGGRAQVYVVDEAAALENPMSVEAALSQTTNCRIDVSTPRGMGNPFAQKRHSGKFPVFSMHWREDPRKNDGVKRYLIPERDPNDPASWETWYEKQVRELDPVTLAQEVNLDYTASATGVLIPSEWVQGAVDAHLRLGITVTGAPRGALDVADEGVDHNALADRQGILVRDVTSWSGEGSDIFATVAKAFGMCDEAGIDTLDYDADGLGAGVRGDARVINEKRTGGQIKVEPFRGSGAVFKPEDPIPSAVPVGRGDRSERRNERRNKDYFKNAKAQAWWNLRVRFMRTHRALEMHAAGADWREAYDEDDLISLNGSMREIAKLTMELSQPTADHSSGKVVIDKAPEGTRSPNLADAVMIAFAPRRANWFDLVT